MPTTVHLLNTVEKQPRPLTQMIHPLSSPQLWNGSEEEMTSAEESSEDEPEVVGLKYAPPTPLPETSTPTNSNAYKYFRFGKQNDAANLAGIPRESHK